MVAFHVSGADMILRLPQAKGVLAGIGVVLMIHASAEIPYTLAHVSEQEAAVLCFCVMQFGLPVLPEVKRANAA